MSGSVKIVHNKLLGGWYVVRGPHQAPLSGRFDSKKQAQAWLDRPQARPVSEPSYFNFLMSKRPPRRGA